MEFLWYYCKKQDKDGSAQGMINALKSPEIEEYLQGEFPNLVRGDILEIHDTGKLDNCIMWLDDIINGIYRFKYSDDYKHD